MNDIKQIKEAIEIIGPSTAYQIAVALDRTDTNIIRLTLTANQGIYFNKSRPGSFYGARWSNIK